MAARDFTLPAAFQSSTAADAADIEDGEPLPELVSAVKSGNVRRVRELISQGADIHTLDNTESSLLHCATYTASCTMYEEGGENVIKYLVEAGLDVDTRDKEEQTPFHWACRFGCVAVAKLLLELGANMRAQDKRGYTGLHHAAMDSRDWMAYWLIRQRGMEVDPLDYGGHTPLNWAVYENYEQLLRLLISLGADINHQDDEGKTPLHWALVMGAKEAARILVEDGCRVDVKDHKGVTANEAAVQRGLYSLRDSVLEWTNYRYYSRQAWLQRVLWFCVGWGFIWLFIAMCVVVPVWMALSITAGYVFLVYLLLAKRWPGTEDMNLFFMGVFKMGWWIGTFTYFYAILPHMIEYTMTNIVWWMLNLVPMSIYIYLTKCDAGVLAKGDPEISMDSKFLALEMREKVPDYCPTCRILRPLRAKHCRACGVCVAKMDHHCPWLGNCVAWKNHRLFIYLVVNLTVNSVFFHFFACNYLLTQSATPDSFWPPWDTWPDFYDAEPLVWVTMSANFFTFLGNVQLLWEQFRNISSNLTQNEQLGMSKYKYLYNSQGSYDNPFNDGMMANWNTFLFGDRIDYSRVYFRDDIAFSNVVSTFSRTKAV